MSPASRCNRWKTLTIVRSRMWPMFSTMLRSVKRNPTLSRRLLESGAVAARHRYILGPETSASNRARCVAVVPAACTGRGGSRRFDHEAIPRPDVVMLLGDDQRAALVGAPRRSGPASPSVRSDDLGVDRAHQQPVVRAGPEREIVTASTGTAVLVALPRPAPRPPRCPVRGAPRPRRSTVPSSRSTASPGRMSALR